MEVGLKFVLVVLLLPIVQVLPLEWKNDGHLNYTCSSNSVTELKIAEMTADSINATIRLSNADVEIRPYLSLSCHNVSSKSAFHGDSCDNLFKDGKMFVVEVKVDTITLPVISNHTLQVVAKVNAGPPGIDTPQPVNLLVLDERKLQVGFATQELELRDNATVLRVMVLNKPLSLGADLELRITLTAEHKQESIRDFSLASDASEHLEVFGGLDPSLVYTAQLSVRNPAQQGSVLLVTPTARLKIALEDILHKMDTNWRARFDKFSDMYQKAFEMYQNASEMYQRASDLFDKSDGLQAAVEELLDQTADSSTPAVTNSTTPADDSTTPADDSTTPADDSTTPADDSTTPADDSTTPNLPTPAITKANPPEVTSESTNVDSNAYYWLLFAGFVAVLVLCVLGYLLFNRRDKVKVYAVSLWKGAENTGKASSSKTASRKYTALPTSIHDTLTHED